jgi:hypothetical protein
MPHRLSRVATAALLLMLAAGCSGGGQGPSASSDAGGAVGGEAAPAAPSPAADGGDTSTGSAPGGGGKVTSARVLPAQRDIVYRGEVTVRVRDVARAVQAAEDLTTDVGGVVSAERTSGGRGAEATAHLSLRVPPEDFRSTLRGLARLGTRLSQTQTAEDVTTQVVDTDSRLRSQRASVARVRALLAQAETVGEVVQVEAELARREADLESLEAQLARLKDVTAQAAIEVELVARAAAAAPDDGDLGFGSGIRAGWAAFARLGLVLLTALGAALPFLALGAVLALLGAAAWRVLRPRQRRAPAAAGAGTEPPAG